MQGDQNKVQPFCRGKLHLTTQHLDTKCLALWNCVGVSGPCLCVCARGCACVYVQAECRFEFRDTVLKYPHKYPHYVCAASTTLVRFFKLRHIAFGCLQFPGVCVCVRVRACARVCGELDPCVPGHGYLRSISLRVMSTCHTQTSKESIHSDEYLAHKY